MKESIKFRGRRWDLKKASETRLLFKIASDDAGRLKAWRQQQGSQREMSKKLGISQSFLAKMELGQQTIPESILGKVHS